MTDIPHFDLPFRFNTSGGGSDGPSAAVVEQDSIDEIAVCVLAILLCPTGFRVELPEFGLNDPTFSIPRLDIEMMRQQIEVWEPRAQVLLESSQDAYDELVQRAQLYVQVRSEE